MKKLLILLLLVPTLAMSGTFKDDEGRFGLKTSSKSGFKFHLNFMDHNDYNFQYIKDKKKHVQESTFSDLSLETVIALEMMVGATVTPIEKELSFQQGHGNLLRKINVMDIV
jgi:hypothetical protein